MKTIQVSSLTNSIAQHINIIMYKRGGLWGFDVSYQVVRAHAETIVRDFLGAKLGGWVDRTQAPPREHGETLVERITSRVIYELHHQTGTVGRVDVERDVRLHITGLVAAHMA